MTPRPLLVLTALISSTLVFGAMIGCGDQLALDSATRNAAVPTEALAVDNVPVHQAPVDLVIDAPDFSAHVPRCVPREQSSSRAVLAMVSDVIGFDAQTNNQLANLLPTSVQHALLW